MFCIQMVEHYFETSMTPQQYSRLEAALMPPVIADGGGNSTASGGSAGSSSVSPMATKKKVTGKGAKTSSADYGAKGFTPAEARFCCCYDVILTVMME